MTPSDNDIYKSETPNDANEEVVVTKTTSLTSKVGELNKRFARLFEGFRDFLEYGEFQVNRNSIVFSADVKKGLNFIDALTAHKLKLSLQSKLNLPIEYNLLLNNLNSLADIDILTTLLDEEINQLNSKLSHLPKTSKTYELVSRLTKKPISGITKPIIIGILQEILDTIEKSSYDYKISHPTNYNEILSALKFNKDLEELFKWFPFELAAANLRYYVEKNKEKLPPRVYEKIPELIETAEKTIHDKKASHEDMSLTLLNTNRLLRDDMDAASYQVPAKTLCETSHLRKVGLIMVDILLSIASKTASLFKHVAKGTGLFSDFAKTNRRQHSLFKYGPVQNKKEELISLIPSSSH